MPLPPSTLSFDSHSTHTPLTYNLSTMRLPSLAPAAAGFLLGSGLVQARSLGHYRRAVECYFYEVPTGSETCGTLAANWGIDVDVFTKLNPGVQCPTLESDTQYCVLGEYTPD